MAREFERDGERPDARTALVTAAAGGMGGAIVRRFVADGMRVVATDISERRLDELAERCEGPGRLEARVRADITDPAECVRLVAEAREVLGRVDVLVNVAGGYRGELLQPVQEIPAERVESAFALSLRSVIQMTQNCAPEMIAHGWGRIVNVASVAMNGSPGQADYAAMKAGVLGFTRTCALEFAPHVTVNAVVPGVIETTIVERMSSELRETYLNRIPMKRTGRPDEVAGPVAFLVSDDGSYVTGEAIYVAGGFRSWA